MFRLIGIELDHVGTGTPSGRLVAVLTLRAARQVGKVLKHLPIGQKEATEYTPKPSALLPAVKLIKGTPTCLFQLT
jgi:hypothetical protein